MGNGLADQSGLTYRSIRASAFAGHRDTVIKVTSHRHGNIFLLEAFLDFLCRGKRRICLQHAALPHALAVRTGQ